MKTLCFPACGLALILAAVAALPEPEGARAQDGAKAITNTIGMKLVLVPAGKFLMGSPTSETERDPEEFAHAVEITKPFYLGVHEVTQGNYDKLMGTAMQGGKYNPWNRGAFFAANNGGSPDHPMEQVAWLQAVEFCKRLSALPDEQKAGRVYRLPTEAEWEYACRAGTTTPFHVGTALSSNQANFNGNYPFGDAAKGPDLQKTVKVGSYPPNAWGLYDMHGNVAEWCSDWYDPDYYQKSPKLDPKGPAQGVLSTSYNTFFVVVRGGCWLDEARGCRAAYRFRLQPTEPYRLVGFRVACEVPRGKNE